MKIESVMTVPKRKSKLPVLSPGDTVRVAVRVVEGDKSRIQPFQGVVIRIHPHDAGGSFTVRRVTYNIGVERTFLLYSPLLEKVDVIRHGKVRRANLYYLRGISAKASRLKESRRREIAPELISTAEPEPEVMPEQKPQAEQQPQQEQKPQPEKPRAEQKPQAEQPKSEQKPKPEQTPKSP